MKKLYPIFKTAICALLYDKFSMRQNVSHYKKGYCIKSYKKLPF